ncbi:hypothetical protein ACQ4PT_030417 [Festuca glaucescens]
MGEFASGLTGLMSKLVQGLTEVEDNEVVDTAKFDKTVRAQMVVSRLSDAGGAANTTSPIAQSSDVRPAQIVGKSPIRRRKNVPCNQSANATDVGGASTTDPLNVLDSVSSPVTAEQTNVVAEVPVVEQTHVTRSAAKAACAANVPCQVDKVPVVNFSDNMSDVESYHSGNDSDYVDESVTARFVIQSRCPVDASEHADIVLSECAAVPSQTTLSGVATVVPGVSPELVSSGVPMDIDGAVAEPSDADAVVQVMETDITVPPPDNRIVFQDASVDAAVSSVGVKSGEVLSSSPVVAVINEDNGKEFPDGYDAVSETINDVMNELKRSSSAFDASEAKRSCVVGEDRSVNPEQNVPSCPPKKKPNVRGRRPAVYKSQVATRSSPRRPPRGTASGVADNIAVKSKGSTLKDRLQGSTEILAAGTSTVVPTGSQISAEGGSDEVVLKDVVVPFKSTSEIVATGKESAHEDPLGASFAPPDFGTSVTNQTADTVGDVAHHATTVIGTTVDVARDAEQNATIFPQGKIVTVVKRARLVAANGKLSLTPGIPIDILADAVSIRNTTTAKKSASPAEALGNSDGHDSTISVDDVKESETANVSSIPPTDDLEVLYITPALPVPIQNLSVASRTPRTKLRIERVVLPSKFMLPPYNRVTSTDEQEFLYQQVIKHNSESEHSKIKESRFLMIDPMWVSTGDLASSVMPSGELSATVAEIGIAVLQVDCPKKKIIFPWIVTVYLLERRFDSKILKKHFRMDEKYKLSHQNLNLGTVKKPCGHWYSLFLNFEKKRFEVLDSARGPDDESLITHSSDLVDAIKYTRTQEGPNMELVKPSSQQVAELEVPVGKQPSDFRTKLSLPKFVAVTKRLTRNQKKLVADIGLEQLLYVTCEYLPRSLIAFLVANFDSQTRSLSLPNGPPVKLNASCINKVLGTPIGGLRIGKKVDPHVRTAIADLTNCKGHYPTISELDKLMTSELDGDTFKIVFTMYAMTAFLCPSSHDAISPNYLHIVENPGEISSFDFSSAVLLKLVSSIEAYNGGTTCVLGGNLFCLMAVYFEFLDTDLISSHVKCNVPRISIWSSSLVSEIEMLDCVCKDKGIFGIDKGIFGSLPTKEISRTPFGNLINEGQTIERNSYEDLLQFVLSITPLESHEVVKAQVPLIISKMQKDIMDTIQPVLVQNVMSLLSMTSGSSPMLNTNEKCKDHSGSVGFKVPSHGFSVCHTPAVQSNTIPPAICIPGQAASAKISDVVTMSDVDYEMNEHVCNDGCLLPVPGDDILDRCTEDAIKDGQVPDIHSIISAMEVLYSPRSLGQLPCNFELLEQMNPAKPDFTQYDDSASSSVDMLQELLRTTLQAEAEHESKLRSTQFPSYENQAFNVTEISPNKVISVFNSTLVEQDVFKDIVHRVPKTAKSKTINIVRMGSTWAEHRVFALSMQVYGNVNKYVINMLGKAVIVEDTEKRTLNLLPEGHWKRYFIPCDESFDEARLKICKVSFLETLPEDEDIFLKESVKTFSASMENRSITQQKLLGYPVGYSDVSLDMESEENIRMTDTTMKILGVSEGSPEGLVRVNLKYLLSPEYIAHAYSVVQSPEFVKFAVDYNSKLYMKFKIPMHAEVMTKSHYFVDRFMIKFYSVKTVKKCSFMEDIGRKCPVYSRLKNEDHFEDHFQSA